MGKVDCSAAELLAVNPFAPTAQTRCRGFGGVTARLGRRNERCHALQGNGVYTLRKRRNDESRWAGQIPASPRSRRRDGGRGEDV